MPGVVSFVTVGADQFPPIDRSTPQGPINPEGIQSGTHATETLDLRLVQEGISGLSDDDLAAGVRLSQSAIDAYARIFGHLPSWWTTHIGTRNSHASPYLLQFAQLARLKRCLDLGQVREVLVDDRGIERAARTYLADTGRISIGLRYSRASVRALPQRVKAPLKFLRDLIWALARSVARWRNGRRTIGVEALTGRVLVAFYGLGGEFAGRAVTNRYFEGLQEYLDDEERQRLVWVPTFPPEIDYRSQSRMARAHPDPVVISHDWLTLWDQVAAVALALRARYLRFKPLRIEGLDVAPLFTVGTREGCFSTLAIEAARIYLLMRRLGRMGARPAGLLIWYEGIALEKSAVLGARRHLPGIRIHGYFGSAPRKALACMPPTEVDRAMATVPDKLFVTGAAFSTAISRQSPSLNIDLAPSFRFSAMSRERFPMRIAGGSLLVALTSRIEDSRHLLRIVAALLERGLLTVPILLKPHPLAQAAIDPLPPGMAGLVEIHQGRPITALAEAAVVLTLGSNIALEAAGFGIPTVIAAVDPLARLDNPIPERWTNPLIRLCCSADDVGHSINDFLSRPLSEREREAAAAMVKDSCLLAPSSSLMSSLLPSR